MKNQFNILKNNDYKAVLWLINKHFWKSKIGPICASILPLFFMIIYKLLSNETGSTFVSGLPSYFAFSILPLCLLAMPQMIVELKTSIILRKISVSSITSYKFCAILLSYYICTLISSNLIIVILFAAFSADKASTTFSGINWGEVVYSLINIYIVSLAIGLLIGVLVKKNNFVQIIGFVIMMISVVFAGQFIPITVLSRTSAIRYISLFSPITYPLAQLNNITIPSNKDLILELVKISKPIEDKDMLAQLEIVKNYTYNGLFDIKHDFIIFDWSAKEIANTKTIEITKLKSQLIYMTWQNILNLVMPWIISIIAIIISLKKFNWTSR